MNIPSVYVSNSTVSPFCSRCGNVLPGHPIWMVGAKPCLCGSNDEDEAQSFRRLTGALDETRRIQGTRPLFPRAAWECPRCHRVNAPHVDSCECEP